MQEEVAGHPALLDPRPGTLLGLPLGWAPGTLALIFKLLEFCSSAPPNLGEVRHMESRGRC